MSDRQRVRVGRDVTYYPTDSEASTGGGNDGDAWTARITAVNNDGTVNLCVFEADGGVLAKTDVEQGGRKGQYDLLAGPDAI